MGTCVPGIGTSCPGKFRGEGAEQVEECPGQDDDVVDVQKGLDDHRCYTNALGRGEKESDIAEKLHRHQLCCLRGYTKKATRVHSSI